MKTILLIEDNACIRENLCEYLQLEGYNTLSARNGVSGYEMAKLYVPDLIICDLLMPQMNGYEVFRLLSETAGTLAIPFIISTGMSEKMDKEKSLEVVVDDYLIKPYELDTLLLKVQKCIQYNS